MKNDKSRGQDDIMVRVVVAAAGVLGKHQPTIIMVVSI